MHRDVFPSSTHAHTILQASLLLLLSPLKHVQKNQLKK
jgi:hypothetical protein